MSPFRTNPPALKYEVLQWWSPPEDPTCTLFRARSRSPNFRLLALNQADQTALDDATRGIRMTPAAARQMGPPSSCLYRLTEDPRLFTMRLGFSLDPIILRLIVSLLVNQGHAIRHAVNNQRLADHLHIDVPGPRRHDGREIQGIRGH